MMQLARKYWYLGIIALLYLLLAVFVPAKATVALSSTWHILRSVAFIILSVFVLIGLVQAWLKEDVIAKKLGEKSGLKAMLVSALFGSILVGPLFAIFPLLKSLLDRGARVAVITVMLTTWAVKIPMIPIEIKFLGPHFVILRVGLILALVIPMSLIMEKIISAKSGKAAEN